MLFTVKVKHISQCILICSLKTRAMFLIMFQKLYVITQNNAVQFLICFNLNSSVGVVVKLAKTTPGWKGVPGILPWFQIDHGPQFGKPMETFVPVKIICSIPHKSRSELLQSQSTMIPLPTAMARAFAIPIILFKEKKPMLTSSV